MLFRSKKGRLYAVIQVKENGKAKAVWRSLGLPEGTGKSKVNKAFREVVKKFEELIRPSYVTQHFSDLLKKYGLRHICFHDLRHTFASILIGQDVPLINVSNFLGHSDLSTTANIYAHLDKASKQASADIMTDILNMVKS